MKLIVGLGNPGKEFENTYHNLGYIVVDKLCKDYAISLNKSKFNSIYGQGKINDEIVFVIIISVKSAKSVSVVQARKY